MFGHLLGWYTVYTFLGDLAHDKILPGAKLTFRPRLAFSIFAALLHGTGLVGVSPTLWRSAEGTTYIRQGVHHVGHDVRYHA